VRRNACARPFAIAGLLVVAVACGSGGDDQTAMTTDPAAVVENTVASTARVSISFDMSAARAEWESMLAELPGEAGNAARSAVSDLGFEGIVDLRAQRGHLVSTGGGMDEGELMELFVDRTRAYVRQDGGPWYFTELSAPEAEAGWMAMVAFAPLTALAEGGLLEVLGADEVRGVAATHYRTTTGTGEDAETVEVWVDAEGRAVRIRTTPPTTPPTTVVSRDETSGLVSVLSVGGMQTVPSTTEFWEFGVAFDMAAPEDAVPAPP
jgi:hypothetical protein